MFRRKGPLPIYSILCETEAKRQELISAFAAIVTEAICYLGKDEVKKVVAKATRAPRGKRKDIEKNEKLLAEYFAEAANGSGVNVAACAKRLDRDQRGKFGASAPAIEKQLRRLLKRQQQVHDASEEASLRWRDTVTKALGYSPASILGSDI